MNYYWPDDARTKHLHIPGMSGYGKTSLMANLALGDLEFHDGPLIIIDPKGSKEGLVERVLPHIPKSLVEQTFYLSLTHPIPIDMMGYRNQFEKTLVKNDIVTILQRFSFGSWGSTMQGILNKLIPTLLEAEDATFLDIGRFLEQKGRRAQILEQVSDERQQYWKENPPSRSDTGPLLTRISNFDEPPLSTICGAKRGEGINIADIIDQNQILLVDTSPLSADGLTVGALVMSRIQQAIFRREPDKEYPRCYVYADEFHNFTTSAFNVMLSQARSFNLSLCLANQHPKQITDVWDDIIGNVSSYMIFRMDGNHAALLKSKIQELVYNPPEPIIKNRLKFLKTREDFLYANFPHGLPHEAWSKEIQDISDERYQLNLSLSQPPVAPPTPLIDQIPHLQIGEAIYVAQDGVSQRIKTPLPPQTPATSYAEQIIEHTYATYRRKRTVDNYACDEARDAVHLSQHVPASVPDGDEPPTLLPDRPEERRSKKSR